mgnify:CR=1 FL=1
MGGPDIASLSTAFRGVCTAVSARRGLFAAVALGVFLLDILVPPGAVARPEARGLLHLQPLAQAAPRLPGGAGAAAGRASSGRLWDIALFWFSADGIFGVEWGFAVTTGDLARFGALALIVATYFALWMHRRAASPAPSALVRRAGAGGGVLGAVSGVLGLSTSACTVMGCGAPVLPVVGLASRGAFERHALADGRSLDRGHLGGTGRARPRGGLSGLARGRRGEARHPVTDADHRSPVLRPFGAGDAEAHARLLCRPGGDALAG